MIKDYLLIVNPVAGKSKPLKHLPEIEKHLSKTGKSYDLLLTSGRGSAKQIASENLDDYKHYVVVGGDGTVNEVINGLDATKEHLPKIGVFPLGSGNDFGKLLHKNRTTKEIAERYFNENYETINSDWCYAEIIEENGSLVKFQFINALGIGFDSFVAKENLETKIFSGLTSYVFAVLRSLKKFNGVRANVFVDGRQVTDGENLLIVTIGNNKTSGGGFYLNPFAEISDGKLDITTIRHLSVPKILRNLPLTLINKIEQVKDFNHINGREIEVELLTPFIVHADGEIFSERAKKISIKMFDKKLEVIA